jgi:thymidylate synthase (FAD)
MKVKLIEHTKLSNACRAGRTCWDSFHKGGCYSTPTDIISEEDKNFLERIINKNKHKSIAEHLVYTFDVDGISRACLQELARHRIASYSVKSTRYTLKELKEADKMKHFLVLTGNTELDYANIDYLLLLKKKLLAGSIANDVAKYMLPEAYKTSLVMTINARSLQNFIELRSSKSALWEIQNLAKAMYDAIPTEHKYLFEDYINEK